MKSRKLYWFLALDIVFLAAFGFWYTSVRNDPNETTFTEVIDELSGEVRNYTVTRDQVYKEPVDSQRQILDIYQPKEASDEAQPVVLWIHGGGWLGGDKNDDVPAQQLVDGGFVVASMNYRFASEATHPAQVNDVNAAVDWLRTNADTYNIDPNNIALMGFSAGGHLAAIAGLSGNTGTFDNPQQVEAVVTLAAPVDLVNFELDYRALFGDISAVSPDVQAAGVLLGCDSLATCDDQLRNASPTTYVDANDPPVYIQQGLEDTLVPFTQADRLNDLLQQEDIASQLETVDGLGHEFEINQAIIDFLKTSFES